MARDIYLSTGNGHKVAEIAHLLEQHGFVANLYSSQYLGLTNSVEETADTMEGNAMLKAEALIELAQIGSFILADDSGLEVDALGGRPGVYSARYAGPLSDAKSNNEKLLGELNGLPAEKRTARFRCVLALIRVGEKGRIFEGVCEGRILESPSGGEGFGYDPIFQPSGYEDSFAVLGEEIKNKISHRARAFEKLAEWLRGSGEITQISK